MRAGGGPDPGPGGPPPPRRGRGVPTLSVVINPLPRLRGQAVHVDADPVAVLLPEPLLGEVRGLLAREGEVPAVRRVRERTGLDLLCAVRAVRHLDATAGTSTD